MTPRGRESTKLCGNFALYITSIIMMLITILLMIEDRCNIGFANNACYVHRSFLICDENACKTNSVIYFKENYSIDIRERVTDRGKMGMTCWTSFHGIRRLLRTSLTRQSYILQSGDSIITVRGLQLRLRKVTHGN